MSYVPVKEIVGMVMVLLGVEFIVASRVEKETNGQEPVRNSDSGTA